jgi:hypothetical protein
MQNKASYAAQTSFKHEPHLETQATERLYKDTPPSALTFIIVSDLEQITSQ